MRPETLIDTGPILAMLDKSDSWHGLCSSQFRQLHTPLLTSEAVLTELFHLVGDTPRRKEAAWEFVRSGALAMATIEHAELEICYRLMNRYSDLPMDFADATLVHLASRESISTIFTVDQNDFAAYRIAGNRRFTILPAERP
jgi:hypothetical protein